MWLVVTVGARLRSCWGECRSETVRNCGRWRRGGRDRSGPSKVPSLGAKMSRRGAKVGLEGGGWSREERDEEGGTCASDGGKAEGEGGIGRRGR